MLRRYWPVALIWVLVAGWVKLRVVPYAISPELEWIRYIDLPGVAIQVLLFGVHGGYIDWRGDVIEIAGTTVFWSLLTISLIFAWRALCRFRKPKSAA
jgi:hypothetical protein